MPGDAAVTQQGDKASPTLSMQNIHSVLTMIQEGRNKMQETIAHNHEETRKNHEELRTDVGEIKDNIRNMDEKIEKIQHKIEENEQRIYKAEERIEHTNKRMEKMEYNQAAINKDLEDTVSYLEMEKASFYLRFQNVEEQKEEDLGEIMTEIFSEVTQRDKDRRREYLCENTTSSMADSEDLLLKKAKADQTGNRIVKVNSGKHYLCGYCAAITNIAVTFPIQKVLFRQQLYGVRTRDAICQLQKDGIRNLYRGILPPLMQKSTTLALMFGLYEDLSSVLLRHISAPEIFARSLAAVLAGTTEAVLTPFERVQTLLQDYKHHDKFTNTYQAFRVLREHGAREYYRGLVPILLRNGPSNALFFGLRGPIKQCLPEATTYSTHLINDFICGGVLGAMLGFLFFPVNVVKARMQSQIGGEFQSFSTVFMKIWLERDRKLTHLFRGAHLNYHRSLISWGIINATYEFLLKLL